MSVTFFAFGSNDRPAHSDADLNLANANARIVLALLGFDPEDLCGRCTLPEARRAIMRARARLDETFARPVEVLTRMVRTEREDGVTAIGRRTFGFACGLSVADISDRLDRFEALIDAAHNDGLTAIGWG